jgi:hypothetical protein
MATVSLILLVLAFVTFILAAINPPSLPARFNLIALGLALWVLSTLLVGVRP